ncbi:MAG: hypothetical protein GY940_35805 [bacterium]|nr:hypothetical protein [bacterium]
MMNMKKIVIMLSVVIILFCISNYLYSVIPAKERAALIAFYDATGGDRWNEEYDELKKNNKSREARIMRIDPNKKSWKDGEPEFDGFGPTGSEGTWYGITVADGHVVRIKIAGNSMNGRLPPELGDFSYLKVLEIGSPRFRVSLPKGKKFSEIKDLRSYTTGNAIGGSIPVELGNLGRLEILRIINCYISGAIPSELGNLTHLKVLSLELNQLGGVIPPELGHLEGLEHLSLDMNQLGGEIPGQLKHLKQLKTLTLSGNLLEGNIPGDLGSLVNLEGLSLRNNRIRGTIPPELGKLAKLEDLNLSQNRLTSSIPHELGNLGNLQYLHLNHNRLTGSIPGTFGDLETLQQLHLNANALTGPIPFSLTNCRRLYYIDFDHNGLYAPHEVLQKYLKRIKGTWMKTQTRAPRNVSAAYISPSSVRVTWSPINYKEGKGGYQVYFSESVSGPWTYAGITPDKHSRSFDVKGLEPGGEYFFVVRTQSNPTLDNKNEIISEPCLPVTVKK